jgi:hypothetical protein
MKYGLKALVFCILIFFLLSGCENPLFNNLTLELNSIAVTQPPSVTAFLYCEPLDITGLEVTGSYTDGKTRSEAVTVEDISGYESFVIGPQELTVTVNGKTAVFEVFVVELLHVTVACPRTVFARGEALDLTGLVVTGHYSGGITREETNFSIDSTAYDNMTSGPYPVPVTIIVTVKGWTIPLSIQITDAQPVGISVANGKPHYWDWELLDRNTLTINYHYSDGTVSYIPGSSGYVSNLGPFSPGEHVLTVTYGAFSADFTITVETPALYSITVVTPPNRTSYPKGAPLDKTGLSVRGYYNDGTSQDRTADAVISGYEPMNVVFQTVTVTVDGFQDSFGVTVTPAELTSIAVTSPPAKDVYQINEPFDSTGMVVTGYWTDGEALPVPATISSFDSSTSGMKYLTVSYNGKTTTLGVYVERP